MADEHGGRWWQQLVADIALGVPVGALVSVLLQEGIERLHIPFSSNVPLVLLALGSTALAVLILLLVLQQGKWTRPLSWTALSALGTLPLAVLLHGSRFYLNGVSGDQSFRLQYLTRFAHSPELADVNYAELPSYYPAGWFWVGGRIAAVLDIPGWAAYKPFALVTMAVAPVVAFGLWNTVVRSRIAFVHAVLTCVVGLRIAAYEPYAWLVAANIPPIAVLLWRTLRRIAAGDSRERASVLISGVFLGISGAVYTLLSGFVALLLVVLAACAIAAHTYSSNSSVQQRLRTAGTVCQSVLLIVVVAVPLTLTVWTPYLVRLARTGTSGNAALHFLPEVGALIPTPMLDVSVSGAICLAGLAWIAFAWRASTLAQALGLLVSCCYLWYLLSFLALAGRATLLPFKLESVLVTALFCASGSGAFALLRWIGRHTPQRRTAAATLAALVAGLALVNLVQTVREAEEQRIAPDMLAEAFGTYDDAGVQAAGPSTPDEPGWWNGRALAAVRELSRKPPESQVMLTSEVQILAFRPYHGFQINNPTYANPLAAFDRRRTLLESWAHARGPDEFQAALGRSPIPPPTVFVLPRDGDDLVLQVSKDLFPRDHNAFYHVRFPQRLFDPRYFLRKDVGPYVVLVRR